MKAILPRLRDYYKIFGWRGPLLAVENKLSTVSKEVEVTIRGLRAPVTLRLATSDIDVCKQFFLTKEYDFETTVSPQTVIDAGANIGLASIYLAHKYPEARIIALEPEESNFVLLKKNVAPYPRILPIQFALWHENSRINLVDPGLGKWGFQTQSMDSRNAFKLCHEVQGVTVDRIMQDQGIAFIDFLKMDIEGAEKEVFQDASKWIEKVGILVVELHEHLRSGCNRSFYNATNNFELEWRRGENVYLARKGRCQVKPLTCKPRQALEG